MVKLAFSHVITVLNFSSVDMVTSLSGSLRTMSEKNLASRAIIPLSSIFPSIIVSIPISISLALSLISLVEASIRIHSRIAIVVLVGTAFDTILTPFANSDFEQVIFIVG